MQYQRQNEQPEFADTELTQPTQPAPHSDQNTHPSGVFIGLAVVALVAIGVGLFLWYRAGEAIVPPPPPTRPTAEMNNEPESTTAKAQVESLGALSTSDELSAIEADIESTDLSSLETELLQIETELTTSP